MEVVVRIAILGARSIGLSSADRWVGKMNTTAALPTAVAEQAAIAHGVWFRVGNAASLANVLRYLLDHPGEVETGGQKARRYFASQFNWDVIAAQYAAQYSDVWRRAAA